MKILEFAFDSGPSNDNLPHNYKHSNCLVYGGTHDNETIVGFIRDKKPDEMEYIYQYLGVKRKKDVVWAMIKSAYASVADTAVFQMQDVLELDNKARMNLPSTVGANWRWRMKEGQFTSERQIRLKGLAQIYGRLPKGKAAETAE